MDTSMHPDLTLEEARRWVAMRLAVMAGPDGRHGTERDTAKKFEMYLATGDSKWSPSERRY